MLGQFVCKTMYDVYLETLMQNTKPPILKTLFAYN